MPYTTIFAQNSLFLKKKNSNTKLSIIRVINNSVQVPTITEQSSGCVLDLQRSNSPYLHSKQTLSPNGTGRCSRPVLCIFSHNLFVSL